MERSNVSAAVVFLLGFLSLTSSQSTTGTKIKGVTYGDVTTPFRLSQINPLLTGSVVTIIQEDEKNKGGFIIATNTAIYSLSSPSPSPSSYGLSDTLVLIAGDHSAEGYEASDGINAQFKEIRGMIKYSKDTLLVSDRNNHCLRLVQRYQVQTTSTFAGYCQTPGDQDGLLSTARLYGPYDLTMMGNSTIYITDSYNRKIKRLDLSESSRITTVHQSDNHYLLDLVIGKTPEVKEFFVTVNHGLLHVLDNKESFLVGGPSTSLGNNNGQFSGVGFDGPSALAWLENSTLLVASTYEATVRIVDVYGWEVYTICQYGGWEWTDGDIYSCNMIQPSSLYVTKDSIYVGESAEKGGIRKIPYNSPQSGTTPVQPGGEGSKLPSTFVFCTDPPKVNNADISGGDILNGSHLLGSTVQYTCRDWYHDKNPDMSGGLTCVQVNDNLYWVGRSPVCHLAIEMALMIILGSGWFLTFILLIVFGVLYSKIRKQHREYRMLHPKPHSQAPLPAPPYSSQNSHASNKYEGTEFKHGVYPLTTAPSEMYLEIPTEQEEDEEEYSYTDQPPPKIAPTAPEYLDVVE